MTPFHNLWSGVSHTEGGGLSHPDTHGVTQTVFEAVEGMYQWDLRFFGFGSGRASHVTLTRCDK